MEREDFGRIYAVIRLTYERGGPAGQLRVTDVRDHLKGGWPRRGGWAARVKPIIFVNRAV
jgi:hypothetical protein